MNKRLIILFLLFSSLLVASGKNSNFDYSGITEFWKIVNIFEANNEPSSSDWNKLFNSPGYRVLTRGEFTTKFFKDNFRLVFKPTERRNLQKALKSRRNSHHLTHYIKIRDNKNKIKDQLKVLKNTRYNDAAIRRTLEYLPQNSVSQYPPVSFVIFESNGRGSSPIVVDLAASIEWDFLSFLSHEYHHWYRNKQVKINTKELSHSERKLFEALSLIEAEGIADMVDKKDWYEKPSLAVSDYARIFLRDVGRTPQIIYKMDLLLKDVKNNSHQINNLGSKISSLLPQRGHTTGYFMARLILKIFGNDKLAQCVGNPFEFILLYNKAAARSGGKYPQFSQDSVSLIKNLSKKYSI